MFRKLLLGEEAIKPRHTLPQDLDRRLWHRLAGILGGKALVSLMAGYKQC